MCNRGWWTLLSVYLLEFYGFFFFFIGAKCVLKFKAWFFFFFWQLIFSFIEATQQICMDINWSITLFFLTTFLY